MALTESESGSNTLVISTLTTLNSTTPETTDGHYALVLDTTNMAASDILEITVHEKSRTGDTQAIIFKETLNDAQADPLWFSPFLPLLHGWDFKLKQTAGTGRVFTWSIRKA